MKSVLISIQPKWCELIASGKKTVEVRKNRPRLKTPFKCYIYCTDGYVAPISFLSSKGLRKTVIGEFVCDSIDEYRAEFCDFKYSDTLSKNCALNQILKVVGFDQDNQTLLYQFESSNEIDNPDDCKLVINSNVTFNEIRKYIGETFFDKPFYGWNISNLIMYDKPKELSEFFVESNQTFDYPPLTKLKRPPQSWCYVEALE